MGQGPPSALPDHEATLTVCCSQAMTGAKMAGGRGPAKTWRGQGPAGAASNLPHVSCGRSDIPTPFGHSPTPGPPGPPRSWSTGSAVSDQPSRTSPAGQQLCPAGAWSACYPWDLSEPPCKASVCLQGNRHAVCSRNGKTYVQGRCRGVLSSL